MSTKNDLAYLGDAVCEALYELASNNLAATVVFSPLSKICIRYIDWDRRRWARKREEAWKC